jgi:uncharacterized protein (TIGR02145 family)
MLSSLDNVTVKNITKGVEVVVPAGNLLRLTDETLLNRQLFSDNDGISVYQHATQGMVTVSFRVPQAGTVQLDVYNTIGSKMMATSRNVGVGKSAFDLRLPMGVYVVRVSGPGYKYSGKLISPSGSSAEKSVVYTGSESSTALNLRSESNVTSLDYTVGDILTYEAVSGIYTSTLTDMPLRDKTIYFDFNTSLKAASSPVIMKVEAPTSVQTSDLISDVDGNVYHTVVIGEQTWLVENLNTTKYADKTKITNVQDNEKWSTQTKGAYCDYANNSVTDKRLGKLYNWYAVTHKNGLAPKGWHVATEAEWNKLKNYLIDNNHWIKPKGIDVKYADARMLAAQEGWQDAGSDYPNNLGIDLTTNNNTGFTALPAGFRDSEGQFKTGTICLQTKFWTSEGNARDISMLNLTPMLLYSEASKKAGSSVRCIKDHLAETDKPTVSDVTNKTAKIHCKISIPGVSISNIKTCQFYISYLESKNNVDTVRVGKPVLNDSIFSLTVSNLRPGTKYFVQPVVTNTVGISKGKDVLTFTTDSVPSVETETLTLDSKSQVCTVTGHVTDYGGSPIMSAGFCWSIKKEPTVADNTTTVDVKDSKFSSAIDGLIGGVRYYVRAYANNGGHIAYGTVKYFNPLIIDADNNKYTTVVINKQTWLLENLKTTKYSNGDSIPRLESNANWNADTTGAYCNYSNLLAYGDKYGRLYNWYAANNSKGLAPNGWRVATEDDWTTLKNTVGVSKSKNLSTSTFKPLFGGIRNDVGVFEPSGQNAYWWVFGNADGVFSTFYKSNWDIDLMYLWSADSKSRGYAVRCIKKNVIDIGMWVGKPTDSSVSIQTQASSVIDLPIISQGVCWSDGKIPTIYDNNVAVENNKCQLNGLSSGTMYSVRAFVVNREGVSYGPVRQFMTKVKDNDGNLYDAVKMGGQTWMTTDLKTTKFRNGDSIGVQNKDSIIKRSACIDFKKPFCYMNDGTTCYNDYAAYDPRGLAPAGWHIATKSEWDELDIYLKAHSKDYSAALIFGKPKMLRSDEWRYWVGGDTGGTICYSTYDNMLGNYGNKEWSFVRVHCVKDK